MVCGLFCHCATCPISMSKNKVEETIVPKAEVSSEEESMPVKTEKKPVTPQPTIIVDEVKQI